MQMSLTDTIIRTTHLIKGMMGFWKEAQGWAPIEAAELLSKSMLE